MSGRSRLAWIFVGSALFVGYALALFHHTSFAAGGSDSSGYLNAARLLAAGRATEPIRGLVRLGLPQDFAPVFVPLGYTPLERPGRMAPSYPPGLPLHMAVAGRIGGWARAPFLVSPLAALACLALVYVLGRELGLPRGFSAAAVLLLAFFPTFVFQALQPMSDVLATAWALAAVLAGLRSRARGSARWAAAAGFAFGIAVLVRPTNAVLLAPLVFAIPFRPKNWIAFIAGGLPSGLFLLGYDAALFGSPWATGYRSAFSEGMEWGNFPARARHYGYWLGRLLTPFVPLGWLGLAADRRAPARFRAVLLSWFGAFFLLYCFYGPYDAWWYTRFLLPGVPALILGAVLVARDLVAAFRDERARRWAAGAAALLLAFALFVEVTYVDRNRVHKFYKGDRQYVFASAMARRRLPPEAIVVSMQMSGALHYYTDLTYAMWNWLLPDRFAALRAETEGRGRRWFALIAPFEEVEVRRNLPGRWREIDRVGDVALWELPPLEPR